MQDTQCHMKIIDKNSTRYLTIIVPSLLIFFSIMIYLGLFVHGRWKSAYTDSEMSYLSLTGQANQTYLEQWIKERITDLTLLSQLPYATQLDQPHLKTVLSGMATSGYYDTIYVVGPDGRGLVGAYFSNGVTTFDQEQAYAFDVADRDWFNLAMSGQIAISEPLISRSTQNHILSIGIPIYDASDNVIAIMRGAVLLDTVLQTVSKIDVRNHIHIYLLDETGYVIVSSETVDDALQPVKTAAMTVPANGENGTDIYHDVHGIEVMGSTTRLSFLPWRLVIEQDYHATMAPFDRVWFLVFVSGTLLFFFLLLAVTLYGIRVMVHPLRRMNEQLEEAYDQTINSLVTALDLRDHDTQNHSMCVIEMTVAMAKAAGLNEEMLGHIRRGALLHDIGKIGIEDQILRKPGKLTEDEWIKMRSHPTIAYSLLSDIPYLKSALSIPYCHHEKWDGTGYPRGLFGEQIPFEARIFAIVDVYDALTRDRPYRKAWPMKKAICHIQQERGKHFDPILTDLFISMVKEQE